jgi:hypothetical protein
MKNSKLYMDQMRRRARTKLSRSFARGVINEAARQSHTRSQFRIAAITVLICILTTISVHWLRTRATEQNNLEAWNRTVAQIRVLEESI